MPKDPTQDSLVTWREWSKTGVMETMNLLTPRHEVPWHHFYSIQFEKASHPVSEKEAMDFPPQREVWERTGGQL